MANFCSQCGRPVDPSTGMCPACNQLDATVRVHRAAGPAPAANTPVHVAPVQPQPVDEDATVRVYRAAGPAPAANTPVHVAPVQPQPVDEDATVRVHRAAGPAPAANTPVHVAPVQPQPVDEDATVRVHRAAGQTSAAYNNPPVYEPETPVEPAYEPEMPVEPAYEPEVPVVPVVDTPVYSEPAPVTESYDEEPAYVAPIPVMDEDATYRVNRAAEQAIYTPEPSIEQPVVSEDYAPTQVYREKAVKPAAESTYKKVQNTAPQKNAEQPSRYEPTYQYAPVEQQYTPVAQDTKPVKKKKSGGTLAATILLTFSVLIFGLLAMLLISLRVFTSEPVMVKTMGSMKFSDVVDFVDKSKAIKIKDTDGEEVTFSDAFYGNLQDSIKNTTGKSIDEKRLKKVIDETTFMQFLGEKFASYAADVYGNTKTFSLEEDEVADALNDNFDIIEDEFNISLTNKQQKKVCEDIAAVIVEEESVENLEPAAFKKASPAIYNGLQIGLSWFVIIILLVLCLLLIFLMIRNDLSQAAAGLGTIFIIFGGLFSVAAVMAVLMPAVWEMILGSAFLGGLLCGYLSGNLIMFVSVFAVGILSVVIRSIVLKIQAKRAYA